MHRWVDTRNPAQGPPAQGGGLGSVRRTPWAVWECHLVGKLNTEPLPRLLRRLRVGLDLDSSLRQANLFKKTYSCHPFSYSFPLFFDPSFEAEMKSVVPLLRSVLFHRVIVVPQ